MTPQPTSDDAEHADQKPIKTCEHEEDYTGKTCSNDAVTAGFARRNHRVNDNGVHITTEASIVWLCEEHKDIHPSVPDAEATIRGRAPTPEGVADD